MRNINNQINDLRNIIGNQGQQVSERLEKRQSTVSSAMSNLQGGLDSLETQFGRLESKVDDFINDKDQGAMTNTKHLGLFYTEPTNIRIDGYILMDYPSISSEDGDIIEFNIPNIPG